MPEPTRRQHRCTRYGMLYPMFTPGAISRPQSICLLSLLILRGLLPYWPCLPARQTPFPERVFAHMKIMLFVLAVGGVLLTGCASSESEIKSDPIMILKQLDQERIQAQIGADSVALDRLYAEDFIGIGPSGTVRAKAQVIADFTSGSLRFQSITTDDVQWRIYGDTAVETGRSTMTGQDGEKTVPRDNRFTRVWVKRQGHWQLVANHYSLLVVHQ